MSPMSTAAMNAVEATKAGVASGILSMSRMVGGTFGVAVLGALVVALGRSRLDALPATSHLPAAARQKLADALGASGVHGAPAQIVDASNHAFVYALQYGLRIGSAVALLGALLAWTFVDGQVPARAPMPVQAEAASVGASATPTA